MGSLPMLIEVQVFEAQCLGSILRRSILTRTYLGCSAYSPTWLHYHLIASKTRENSIVMNHPGTDRRPLLLPWKA